MSINIYEELVNIDNEDEFEKRSNEIINEFISSMPDDKQHKFKQLQFRINKELYHFKNPIARMNKMCELLMEDGLFKLNEVLNGSNEDINKSNEKVNTNNVVKFERRDHETQFSS